LDRHIKFSARTVKIIFDIQSLLFTFYFRICWAALGRRAPSVRNGCSCDGKEPQGSQRVNWIYRMRRPY